MIPTKKGQGMTELQLILVGNIVLLLLLCATVFAVNIKMTDNTGFIQRQQAQDIALTINALKASPQQVQVVKQIAEGIDIEVKENPCRVQTSVTTKKESSPTEVRCNGAQDIIVQEENGIMMLSKETINENEETIA